MLRINSFLFIKKNIIFQGLPCLPGYLVTLFGDPVFTVIFYLPKADVFARIETQMRNFVIHMSENFVIHMHDSAHSPLHLGGMYTVQYNNIGGQNQSPSGNWSNFGHGASSYVLLKFSPRQLHAIHHICKLGVVFYFVIWPKICCESHTPSSIFPKISNESAPSFPLFQVDRRIMLMMLRFRSHHCPPSTYLRHYSGTSPFNKYSQVTP